MPKCPRCGKKIRTHSTPKTRGEFRNPSLREVTSGEPICIGCEEELFDQSFRLKDFRLAKGTRQRRRRAG